jgi:hypothetical protein
MLINAIDHVIAARIARDLGPSVNIFFIFHIFKIENF